MGCIKLDTMPGSAAGSGQTRDGQILGDSKPKMCSFNTLGILVGGDAKLVNYFQNLNLLSSRSRNSLVIQVLKSFNKNNLGF